MYLENSAPQPDPDSNAGKLAQIGQAAAIMGSWSGVIEAFRSAGYVTPCQGAKVIAMGDIHGASPESILEDLQRVGFIGSDGVWTNPQGRIFVQMGDVVDRGRYNMEDYNLLCDLQRIAPAGQVVRLFGNHDFYHLIGFPQMISARPIAGLQQRLIDDVLAGNIKLAWTDGDIIYSHAGIDLGFFPEFVGQSNETIVDQINTRFAENIRWYAEALESGGDRYKLAQELINRDSIFDGDRGIFWTRDDIGNEQFRQVVGHTPQDNGVARTPSGQVYYIDTGRIFGELGRFDQDKARELFANSHNSVGIQHLAKNPKLHREFRERE